MSDGQVEAGLRGRYSHGNSECLYDDRFRLPNCPQNVHGTLQYRCLFASISRALAGIKFWFGSSLPDRRIMNFAHKGAFRCDWLPLTSTDPELSGRNCRVLRLNFSRDKRRLWPNFFCSDLVWISPSETPRRLQLPVSAKFFVRNDFD
jgi:hypothetical protein